MEDKVRCSWPGTDPLMVMYHDEEWGVPCHIDRKLFEYIVLDTFQAGLSWRIILHKRENFRRAFDDFDPVKVANYGLKQIMALENDVGIIRNKLKIAATVTNAQAFLKTQEEFGSFERYIWQFVGSKQIINHHQLDSDIGATSPESDAMSADLKKRGFKFIGSTVAYAFMSSCLSARAMSEAIMQGAGLVNDHLVSCYRYTEVQQ